MDKNKQTSHVHPVLRDSTALPPKRVEPRLVVPVEEPSVVEKPIRKKRTGCCG